MQRKKLRKLIAIFMAGFILCWSSLPSISMAFFITPGKAIQPGEAITPGTPISGGQFIIPGDPINGGKPYQPGSIYQGGIAPVSGQPIIPANHIKIGQFIIPNIAGIPSNGNWLVAGSAMQNGGAVTPGSFMTGGNVTGGGTGPSDGNSLTSGNATEGGTGLSGGAVPIAGNGPTSGDSLTSGNATEGGTGPSGGAVPIAGNGPTSGDSLTSGNATEGGTGPSSGAVPIAGNGPTSDGSLTSGNATEGGTGPSGDDAKSGQIPTGGEINNGNLDGGNGNSASSTASFVEGVFKWGKDLKKVVITVPKYLGEMLDGSLSMWAGFNIKDLKTASGNKNLFQVNGKATVVNGNNKLSTYLNMRYSAYLDSFEHSKAVVRAGINGSVSITDKSGKKTTRNFAIFQPRSGSEIKQKKIQSFLDEVTSFKSVLKKTKDYMKKNWIPFEKGGINKSFFDKSSVMSKGNGIANVVLSVGYRLSQNAADSSRTGTDLAAGITTDILIGAGQTAISAGAGWAAVATAASFGSVVPGIGTLVGAGVGLGIALFLSSKTGRRFSGKVESVVKLGINKLKKVKFGEGLKGLFGGGK